MMPLIAIPVLLLALGGLFLLLVVFHIVAALLVFGGISLLFIIAAGQQVRRARTFRSEWLSMQVRNVTPDDLWEESWRKFMFSTGIFLATWAALFTFFGICYAVFLSMQAGEARSTLLLVFIPPALGYSAIVAAVSAYFGCFFAWLWVKTSPMAAVMMTSAPFIVIASMAVTMIVHLH